MTSDALTYRDALDTIDAAETLSRTARSVLRALAAVTMGPRARGGRPVAYMVLGHLARCSVRTVARAVEHLEQLGLVRRLLRLEDARAGHGYIWTIDPAAVAALTPRMGFLERCAQRRATRAAKRSRALELDPPPSDKLADTESGQQKQNNTNNSARASVAPEVEPRAQLEADPRDLALERHLEADPRDLPLERHLEAEEPPRSRIFAAIAAIAAATIAPLKRPPAPGPSTPSSPPPPTSSPPPEKRAQAPAPPPSSPPILEAMTAAHGGRFAAELAELVAQHGEAHVKAAWSHALETAKYQPPRPAYLRAWLQNPQNTAAPATPQKVSGGHQKPAQTSPYSGAHQPFPERAELPPEPEDVRAKNLDLLAALMEELK